MTWKDPKKSAKVFGISLAVLIALKYLNIVNLFFKLSSFVLAVSGVAEYLGRLVTGTGFASKFKPAPCSHLNTFVKENIPKYESSVAALEAHLLDIVYSKNIETTLKLSGLSFVLYKITSWFSLFQLLFVGLVSAFTLPVIYVNYEKEIKEYQHKVVGISKEKYNEVYKQVGTQIEPHVKKVQDALSPYTAHITKYLPKNRTAGSTVGAEYSKDEPSVASKPSSSSAATAPTATASGASVHSTTAASKLPSVPSASLKETVQKAAEDSHIADNVEFNDLKQAIKEDKIVS